MGAITEQTTAHDQISDKRVLYTQAELSRVLRVPPPRLRELTATGQLRGPDVMIPGGGHKAARWTHHRLQEILADWSV